VEGVREAYSVTRERDFVAIVGAARRDELREVIAGRIAALPGVARTPAMVAFEVFSRHDLEAAFDIGP
jgi:DNA-binding Lrp family transcriptional regulator